MLAYHGGHIFDPSELSLDQAGEAAYAGLYWRVALVGDALITTDGRIMRAASDTAALNAEMIRRHWLSPARAMIASTRAGE